MWWLLRQLDRFLGRGSYPFLREWLAPERKQVQDAYPRLVLSRLTEGMRWLDAGGGHQVFETRFAQHEKEAIGRARLAVGCDVHFPSLRRHRSLDRRVCCELDRLPFADGSFDLVTMHWVVEHLEEPEGVFREVMRVLDRGGLLAIRTPNVASYWLFLVRLGWRILPTSLVYRLIRYMEDREPEDVFPTHYRANSRQRLSRLLRATGAEEEYLRLVADRPLFYFVAPLAALELLVTRVASSLGWTEVSSDTILAIYRKGPA